MNISGYGVLRALHLLPVSGLISECLAVKGSTVMPVSFYVQENMDGIHTFVDFFYLTFLKPGI